MTSTALQAPPKLAPDTLRITPLGGHGDVGRNMSMHECNGEILLIDCGVLFPEDNHPGVDLILPGLDALRPNLDRVQGLILTHGHEDHIGAVPYLLRMRADIPIYGSKLTLALLREKLREHRLTADQFHVVAEGDGVRIGKQFQVEFLAVNHSIPDALAAYVRTPGGSVLHTGDFKMDQLPLDGRITDLRGFARVGERGVDVLMADSTNAESRGFTPSERETEPAIERVFAGARGKIVVACFSSHVHRVQQVLDLAHKYGRKVCYVGRSMVRNMNVARDLGYLHVPGGTLVELKRIDEVPDDQLVIICTGSQGEPLSALARMANREHPVIKIEPTDTVLLASSLIPGNENSVYRVINGLARLGARVVHKGNALVHVSGHACEGELLYTYNIVKPANALPVHGEVRMLIRNAELAVATGVKPQQALVVEDGMVVDVRDHVARVVGKIDASYIFVDGSTVGDGAELQLTDRLILGEEGFISVVAVIDAHNRRVLAGPDIHARGFAEDDSVFSSIRDQLSTALVNALQDGTTDTHALQQILRRVVGRWVSQTLRRRPMIFPLVISA